MVVLTGASRDVLPGAVQGFRETLNDLQVLVSERFYPWQFARPGAKPIPEIVFRFPARLEALQREPDLSGGQVGPVYSSQLSV